MKSLYCPQCSSYLEGGSGDLVDCYCGWKQPEDPPFVPSVESVTEKVELLIQHLHDVLTPAELSKIDSYLLDEKYYLED